MNLPDAGAKLADLTGPGRTDRWGMACTDLGATVRAADGTVVSVFGDSFAGAHVGDGDWRSPVVLLGRGSDARGATHTIRYDRAGGADPDYARRLRRHRRDRLPRPGRPISTVIPSDLLVVGEQLYLHVIVNRGFGTVAWTEIWRSSDTGVRWTHLRRARFPGGWRGGFAQCWSWEYDPDDGWVYIASTGFQRDKGIILSRVRPEHLGHRRRYQCWGRERGGWRWGADASVITPPTETWGELSLRRLAPGAWVLGGFCSSRYALGYRVLTSPTDPLDTAPLQLPVRGSSWDGEDHDRCRVAQLYGGYVLPGSTLDVPGGVGLMVSQWKTAVGWPYRVMQFRVTLGSSGYPG